MTWSGETLQLDLEIKYYDYDVKLIPNKLLQLFKRITNKVINY